MIKKITHIIIAALILIASSGCTLNMHYCHDQLIDLAIFSQAKSCCEVEKTTPCETSDGILQMDHCKDESLALESTDDFTLASIVFDFENESSIDLFILAAVPTYLQPIEYNNYKELPRYKLPPPPQDVDLTKIQSFLI